MSKAFEFLAGLTVGTVESVSPTSISILLDTDAPQTTALNTGVPSGFPRINGYLLVPGQTGAVVGQIAWLGVERSPFPKRPGLRDFGLIDLPYPSRKLILRPIGTLRVGNSAKDGVATLKLERGITTFPSVGDSALLPTNEQIKAIVESTGDDRRVEIGLSPLSDNAKICVDPNKLFGRHAAILGNTGSGKSCTVAGLIRWSTEAALKERQENDSLNLRFVVLDPNGEYGKAFDDIDALVDVVRLVPDTASAAAGACSQLVVPAWLWNAQEWFAFTHASPKTQQPILIQSLHELRTGTSLSRTPEELACRRVNGYKISVRSKISLGPNLLHDYKHAIGCHRLLDCLREDLKALAENIADPATRGILQEAAVAVDTIQRRRTNVSGNRTYQNGFSCADLEEVIQCLCSCDALLPPFVPDTNLLSPDIPLKFDVGSLPGHVELVSDNEESGAASQFTSFLRIRLKTMLGDQRIKPIIDPASDVTVCEWLEQFLGSKDDTHGKIAVIDLSLVHSEVLHIVVATIGRLLFEATQRHRKVFGAELPTVLVLEEAHSFIHAGVDDPSGLPTPTQLCRRVFERIAREGRKFGLGLLLASQRPSELSPTILSQCNTFVLHRLVNDKDQEYVGKLVPDLLADLLTDLPSLPSQFAILLGWASAIPKLVRINDLPEAHRPRSEDPKFWEVWTGKEKRPVDWQTVVDSWVGHNNEGTDEMSPSPASPNAGNDGCSVGLPTGP